MGRSCLVEVSTQSGYPMASILLYIWLAVLFFLKQSPSDAKKHLWWCKRAILICGPKGRYLEWTSVRKWHNLLSLKVHGLTSYGWFSWIHAYMTLPFWLVQWLIIFRKDYWLFFSLASCIAYPVGPGELSLRSVTDGSLHSLHLKCVVFSAIGRVLSSAERKPRGITPAYVVLLVF